MVPDRRIMSQIYVESLFNCGQPRNRAESTSLYPDELQQNSSEVSLSHLAMRKIEMECSALHSTPTIDVSQHLIAFCDFISAFM